MSALSLAPLLTQPDHMREVFQRDLAPYADGRWLIVACEVRQVRRRISNRTESAGAPYLELCYRLEAAAADGGRTSSHWWVAKAYRHEAGAAAFVAARAAATQTRAVAFLAELDLVLWRLPHDPGVPHLVEFLDPSQAALQIGAAIRQPAPALSHVNIVRHEPGEHCTARFTFGADAPWRALYGKCFGDARWQSSWHTMSALARQGRDDAEAFLVPAPVACAPALQAWWQLEAPGRPLAEHLGDGAVRRQLATALARLQAHGPRANRALVSAELTSAELTSAPLMPAPRMPADLLRLAHKWRKKLVRAHAAPADAIDSVLSQLEARPPTSAAQPAHGDFHAGQMLYTPEGRIALFDYDNLVEANACHDAAHFVSQHLTDHCEAMPSRAAEAVDFLAAWQAACKTAPGEGELDWMLRMMCLRKAYSFFVHQGVDWPRRIDRALSLASGGLQALCAEAAADTARPRGAPERRTDHRAQAREGLPL